MKTRLPNGPDPDHAGVVQESPASSHSPWSLAAAICLGLMVALVIGGNDLYFRTPIMEQGDIAVNALQVDNAKHGVELYGNYSRFMFNHPGPAFFYVYAAGERVLHDWLGLVPAPHNAHLLASLFLQVSFFALAIAIVHCWIGSWTFVALALLGGMWHFSLAQHAFTSVWPPYVLLMPFLAFLAATSSFAAGRTSDLAIAVVAGGFLFHGHVAQPLFVGGLGATAAFLHYRGLRAGAAWSGWRHWCQAHRGLVWFCSLWTVLLLLPLVADVVLYGLHSNVSVIAHQFFVNTQEGKNALQSLLYFLSFPTYAANQEDLFTQLGPQSGQFFRDHLLILAGWFIFLGGPAVFAWRGRNRLPAEARRFFAAAYGIWAITAVLCVLWGMLQAGPMHQFNGYFYFSVWYFAGLLSVGVICAIPGRLLPMPITAALCGVAGISASWLFRAPRLNPDESGAPLRERIQAALRANAGRRPKLLVFEHYAWPTAAALALALQREHIPFYVSPAWNFMFGRQHDSNRLGAEAEKTAEVWRITRNGPGGQPLTNELQLFTQPGRLDPKDTVINFELRANAFRFVVTGVSPGNIANAWSDQRRTVLSFQPAPAGRDVRVLLDVEGNTASKLARQPAELVFNGHPVGIATAGTRQVLTATIPRDLWNAAPNAVLELRYPEAISVRAFPLAASDLWFAWRLWKITFTTAPPE